MKNVLLWGLFLIVQLAQGQINSSVRQIAYFDGLSAFYTGWNLNLQNKLFAGAKENKIKLYHFDSFNKEPKEITYSSFEELFEVQASASFSRWSPGKEYHQVQWDQYGINEPASVVVYNKHLFAALKDSKKIPPTDTVYWVRAKPELYFKIMALDYSIQNQDTALQFIHFFHDKTKYCVSLKASEIQSFLNSTNHVWFQSPPGYASHVVGNLFLFDSWDRRKAKKDLWPLLDTVKLKITWPYGEEYRIHTFEQLNAGKVTAFAIGFEESYYDKTLMAKITKFIEGDKREFYLVGDAFINFKMFPISMSTSKKEFNALKTFVKTEKSSTVARLQLTQNESFDFKTQIQNNKFIEEINRLMHLIFEGVSENKIRVYKDETLSDRYSPAELVKSWSRHKIEEWDQYDYNVDETVTYQNEYYTSLANNNSERPENNPQRWEKGKIAIVQPEFVRSMDFNSQTVFDTNGILLERKYSSVKLDKLGHFRYDEIKDYITKANPVLWKNFLKWLDGGLYDVSPLSLTAQK